MKTPRRSIAVLVGLALVAVMLPTIALADGEAGVVIQHGDGSTEAFCIAFTGDTISGDQLLKRAAVAQENVNGLVCSVGQRAEEGCYGAGTFETCTCKCRNPGSGCTYWAFYTQKYGQQWQYSALGFLAQRSRDGDLQGWRWGQGSANSAPPPSAITFEQVCGHAPRAGIAPTTTASATAPATIPTTLIPPTGPTAGTRATLEPVTPSVTAIVALPSEATRVITIDATRVGELPAPTPRTSLSPDTAEPTGGPASGGIAFALVAAGLAAMIVAAVAWKRGGEAKWRKRRGR